MIPPVGALLALPARLAFRLRARRPRRVRLCAPARLEDGGRGLRFRLWRGGTWWPAFAVRYEGRVRAFLNRCAHRGVELDWEPGVFFSADGRALLCATHGARYHPATGACLGGPCGGPLAVLEVEERGDGVYLKLGAGEAAEVLPGD